MISKIIERQREFFLKGKTRSIDFRLNILRKIRNLITSNYDLIITAFNEDLNKCEFDVVATELGMVITEIDYFIKNLRKLSEKTKVKSNLINTPSKGYIIHEPYGVTLIMSPWNYPLQLSVIPLVGAIAAGNTVVLKPSNYSKAVSNLLYELLSRLDERVITVVLGGRDENQDLLNQKFDYIFFTGSPTVGKYVMEKASRFLTPVTLELGGKSPCIIDENCNLDLACKRIVWGKFLNAGQTCVAPDYVLVHKNIHNEFVRKAIHYINKYYYNNNRLTKDFTAIINKKHLERLSKLIDPKKVVFGGGIKDRIMEPTILDGAGYGDKVMKEEIFGPIMPIVEYESIDNALYDMKRIDKPLALYVFSNNQEFIWKVINNISSGGVCINDVIMHLTNDDLPFGGVGNSGMGSYHGKKSFETFSHERSVFEKGKTEINVKYPPYNDKNMKLIKKMMGLTKKN